jgi:hypothetical protein
MQLTIFVAAVSHSMLMALEIEIIEVMMRLENKYITFLQH